MARIDKAALVAQAADAAKRADFVRRDPAVIKAAKEVGEDFSRAARSTARLADEARSAWRRAN